MNAEQILFQLRVFFPDKQAENVFFSDTFPCQKCSLQLDLPANGLVNQH